MRFGPFTFDPARRQLTRGDRSVHLTPKAFDLLALLVKEAPRVVPKHELHERLWPGTFVADATLVGLVKELRRALDDRDRGSPVIRTAHRVGYSFCLDVEGAPAASPGLSHWITAGGRRFPLHEGENVIGRDPASDVCLDAAGISRRHARVIVSEAAAFVEDLGSKNGTTLDGVKVAGRAPLEAGDRISFGSMVATYRRSRAGISTETHTHAAARTRRAPAES